MIAVVFGSTLGAQGQARAGSSPAPPAQSAEDELGAQLRAMVIDPAVARDHWGVMVTTLDGAPIASVNEGQLFQPASNTKLYTTAAAMALLGPETTFHTTVASSQGIVGGHLKGDLVLKGDGDPNLSGRAIPYVAPAAETHEAPSPMAALHVIDELAEQLVAAGLKVVDGTVVGDDTLFPWEPYAPDWSIDDMVWGYGAPVSALSINDNQIRIRVAPGALTPVTRAHQVNGPDRAVITLDPALPYYTIENNVVTVEAKGKTNIQMERAPGSRIVRVYGTIAADATPDVEQIAIDDPALYAASSLKAALIARGVQVSGQALPRHRIATDAIGFQERAQRPVADLAPRAVRKLRPCRGCGKTDGTDVLLAEHTSFPLVEDIVVTNKVSQNLHAELLLRQMSVSYSDDLSGGSIAQGAAVVRQFLVNAGIDKDDFVFFDGSGLSGHDLVTPRATAKLLAYASTQPWFAGWKASLPVAGVDGSLQRRFSKPPLNGHVFAKTGTLAEAHALSGYLDCASGRTVIFSIMVGNHPPGTPVHLQLIDRMVGAIAAAL
ncbi:MAG: D-alanyl-D-alanine carboxypeptidase/D-alanyl-D-alanine-endopeptidase [Acidobacteriaceae bacterium]